MQLPRIPRKNGHLNFNYRWRVEIFKEHLQWLTAVIDILQTVLCLFFSMPRWFKHRNWREIKRNWREVRDISLVNQIWFDGKLHSSRCSPNDWQLTSELSAHLLRWLTAYFSKVVTLKRWLTSLHWQVPVWFTAVNLKWFQQKMWRATNASKIRLDF